MEKIFQLGMLKIWLNPNSLISQKRRSIKNKDHQIAAIENKLIEILGTKVKLKSLKRR